jgi:hypothetical protein
MLPIENDGLPSGKHPKNLENPAFYSWLNPPFRLGHGFNSFLYVDQAGPKKRPAASWKNCCLQMETIKVVLHPTTIEKLEGIKVGPAGTII